MQLRYKKGGIGLSRGLLTSGLAVLVATGAVAQGPVVRDEAGSGTWTVPDGVTKIDSIEVWGGGGGTSTINFQYSSGGGGGGAYAKKRNITVTPGQVLNYQVGAGGYQAGTFDLRDGTASWCELAPGVKTVMAAGGKTVSGGRLGGIGGTEIDDNSGDVISIGDVIYPGGNGGGAAVGPATVNPPYSGGGGGAGGPGGPGSTGSTSGPQGGSSSGGGAGGSGWLLADGANAARPGNAPGGGAGGPIRINASSLISEGAAGGAGRVVIYYTPPASPEIELASVTPSSFCPYAAHDAEISFTSSGFTGTPAFTVELSDASGFFTSPVVIASGSSSPLTAAIPGGALTEGGNFRIRVSGGGVPSNEIPLTLTSSPAVNLSGTASLCAGTQAATLTFSNASGSPDQYGITWNPAAAGAGFTDVRYTAFTGGSVTVSVPSAVTGGSFAGELRVRNSTSGCISTAYPVSLTVNELPAITLVGANPSYCPGTTIGAMDYNNASGSPGQYSLTWSSAAKAAGFSDVPPSILWGPGSNPFSIPIAAGAAAGTYHGAIRVHNTLTGCSSVENAMSVTIRPLPRATLGTAPAVCQGAAAAVLSFSNTSGDPEQFDISWTPAAIGAGLTNIAKTALPSSGSVSIAVPANIAAATYKGSFRLYNNALTCLTTLYDFDLVVNPKPDISTSGNPMLCAGETSVSLPYSGTTGAPAQYGIEWAPAAGSAGFADVAVTALPAGAITIAVPGNAAAGSYTGTMTLRNTITGCSNENRQITVEVNARPGITLGSDPAVCKGAASAALTYTGPAGAPDVYSVIWNTTAVNAGLVNQSNVTLGSASASLSIPAAVQAGTYGGSITVRNSTTGCTSAADNFSLILHALPDAAVIPAGPLDICEGDDALLTAPAGTGYSYEWKEGVIVKGSQQSYPATATGSYHVVVTDGNSCRDSSEKIQVTVHNLPSVRLVPEGDTAICTGSRLTLEAESTDTGLEYTWMNGITVIPAAGSQLEVSSAGSYLVIATRTGIAGCADTSGTILVDEHSAPEPSITRNGESLITEEGYTSYQWLKGGMPVSTPGARGREFIPREGGAYAVRVTDRNGCEGISDEEEFSLSVAHMDKEYVRIYPNPARHILYIESRVTVQAFLYDMQGRLLAKYSGHTIDMKLAGFPEGGYLVTVADTEGRIVRKEHFIKY